MAEDIRAMTAELAADPASLVFLELGETLRRRGQLQAAFKVARNGVARYPELAAAHDLAARILADRGELDRAFEAWVTALKHDPALLGAHKGLGFLYYRAGDLASAEKHLAYVVEADAGDAGTSAALAKVREEQSAGLPDGPTAGVLAPPGEPDRRSEPASFAPSGRPAVQDELPFSFEEPSAARLDDTVFAGLEGGSDSLLLVDANGLRLGGGLRSPAGHDVADAVAAQLSGVSKEAARAARLLALGEWRGLAVESPDGNLYLTAPTAGSLLLTARGPELPMGRVARLAERAAGAARRWLEGIR
ncbi:MAG TPA: roadblock/LC7 domain-containing protein [Gemmatimonadales bacterium]|nr:roadblock/LC7 domain-containing protein [Gemmatimonadales bacterium]